MPYTSNAEDTEFGAVFLGAILEHIVDSFAPDAVFDEDVLKEWMGSSAEPEDVFSTEQLQGWAEANGYVEDDR